MQAIRSAGGAFEVRTYSNEATDNDAQTRTRYLDMQMFI